MNPTEPDDSYEKWRAQRSQDFSPVDLSRLVMASVRRIEATPKASPAASASYLEVPSYFVRAARFVVILLFILAPA